jgi:hypothetical protein
VRWVSNLTGQIQGIRSHICQDRWVSNWPVVLVVLAEGCEVWNAGLGLSLGIVSRTGVVEAMDGGLAVAEGG